MADLEGQVLDYLRTHNTMTLGTCLDGAPWNATVFYASDRFRLYFFSSPDSRHAVNLAANPRVAVTVQEDYADWREIKGIQLEGTAELVDSVAAKAKALAVYARKYPGIVKLFTDPASGVYHRAFLKVKFYRVTPETLYFIDNQQGFGKRQELDLGGGGPRPDAGRPGPPRRQPNRGGSLVSRLVGKEMPEELFALMNDRDLEAGKVMVMATVDEKGWAHPAMGSRFEMMAKGPGRIHLAVGRNSTTERNLVRTGALTLVVTDHGMNFYLKGDARRTREQLADTPFALFQVELHTVLEDQDPAANIVTGVRFEWGEGGNAELMRGVLRKTCEALQAAPWE